ncbi:uncharacterized protein LOC128211197 isoform X1 [Mya arenaria]|nr:uncharacterized protein LOC128211197 isoform X1 [Mya arenaria]
METYLTLLYVTIEQEVALKELFLSKGWLYAKPDLSVLTSNVGPPESFTSTGGIVKFTDDNGATEQRAKFVHPKVVENEDGIVEDTCVKVEYDDEYGGDTDEVLTGQDYDDDDYNADDHDDDDDFADLVEAAEPVNEAPKETRKSPRNRSKKTKAKSVLTNQKTAQVISFQADGSLAQTVKETPKSKKRKVDGAEVGEGEAVDREDMMSPTIRKASKKRRLYDTGLIARAYKDVVESGMSVYKAARLYGLPESTLRDRTLGLQPVTDETEYLPCSGHQPTFTTNEEKQLVDHISYMASIGYSFNRVELLNLATDWAMTLGRKKENDPPCAASWYTRFKRRNPDVALAKPQKLSVLRAQCTSEETMNMYHGELEKVMRKYDLENHPEFIWTVDETGLIIEHDPYHADCVEGFTPQAITSNRGKTVTIIACGSAAGSRLPPYYVFPGIRWNQDLLTGASPGSGGTMTESGCSSSLVFMMFLEQHFMKHVTTRDHPVMILFDGHKSHINLTLSAWGEANNIVFYVLPPHTSHVTHPIDGGCFGPLKNLYHSECQAYLQSNPGMPINCYNIAQISSKAYNKGVSPDNLISAFRKTGVFPRKRGLIIATNSASSTICAIDHTGDHEQSTDDNQNVESFLHSRKIIKVVETSKKTMERNPTIITTPSKEELMTPTVNTKKVSSSFNFDKKSVTKKSDTQQMPGSSGDRDLVESDPHSEYSEQVEEEVAEEELCCVCKKFAPEPMNPMNHLELLSWGECERCGHWTHLKYCCSVKVLQKQDKFLCPCCDK